jgi:hypothetical protein
MPDVRHTDVEMAEPSTRQQRRDAAQRAADAEIGDDQQAVNVVVAEVGTRVGDDSRMWWEVTYEVIDKPRS